MRVVILSARTGWHTDELGRALTERGHTSEVLPYEGLVARFPERERSSRATSLDDELPEDAPNRYAEASRRLGERLRAGQTRGEDASIVYADLYGVPCTLEKVARDVLMGESGLVERTA